MTYFAVAQPLYCDTAMLCVQFQNNWTTDMDVMAERVFARFKIMGVLESYPIIAHCMVTPPHTRVLSVAIFVDQHPLQRMLIIDNY